MKKYINSCRCPKCIEEKRNKTRLINTGSLHDWCQENSERGAQILSEYSKENETDEHSKESLEGPNSFEDEEQEKNKDTDEQQMLYKPKVRRLIKPTNLNNAAFVKSSFIVILHKFSLRFLCSLPIDRNFAREVHARATE